MIAGFMDDSDGGVRHAVSLAADKGDVGEKE